MVSAFFGETLSAVCCVAVGDSVLYSTEVQQSKTVLIGAQPTAAHSLKRQSPAKPTEHFFDFRVLFPVSSLKDTGCFHAGING